MLNSSIKYLWGGKDLFSLNVFALLCNVFSWVRSVIHRVSCTQTNILRTRINKYFSFIVKFSLISRFFGAHIPLFTTLIYTGFSKRSFRFTNPILKLENACSSFALWYIQPYKCHTNMQCVNQCFLSKKISLHAINHRPCWLSSFLFFLNILYLCRWGSWW